MSIKSGNILRWGRIAAALAMWVTVTAGLTSYGMTFPRLAAWIGRVQFMPAAIAFAITVIATWLIITLVFGRVYCSVGCPLGVWQDICSRLPRMRRHMPLHLRYHYSAPLTRLRNISLVLTAVSIFLGIGVATSHIDPWGIYSDLCTDVLKPLWGTAVNAFSAPPVMIASASLTGIAISLTITGVISWLATKNGRTFCNSVCPVGTTLGNVAKYSIYHIDINTDKCTQCRKCEHACKASCIDLNTHVVDSSRCVECFDCLPVCEDDAIHYTWSRHKLATPLMIKVGDLKPPGSGRFKLDGCTGCSGDQPINRTNNHQDATISRPTEPDHDRGN